MSIQLTYLCRFPLKAISIFVHFPFLYVSCSYGKPFLHFIVVKCYNFLVKDFFLPLFPAAAPKCANCMQLSFSLKTFNNFHPATASFPGRKCAKSPLFQARGNRPFFQCKKGRLHPLYEGALLFIFPAVYMSRLSPRKKMAMVPQPVWLPMTGPM